MEKCSFEYTKEYRNKSLICSFNPIKELNQRIKSAALTLPYPVPKQQDKTVTDEVTKHTEHRPVFT